MALVIADRLGQVTTTTGTGAYTTSSLITAMASLDAALLVGDYFYGYVEAVDANGNATGSWEVGRYTKTATNTFARTEIHSSSNSGSAVSWAAGNKHIKLALTAYQLRYIDHTVVVNEPVTPLPIPNNIVLMSDYSGVPGASGETIFNAWNSAIAQVKALGGGTLVFDAGTYAMGALDNGDSVFFVNNLTDALIDMRGAIFTCTTSASSIANLFHFQNPNNVTCRGGKMIDSGYSASSGGNDRGSYFIRAQSTTSTICNYFKVFEGETDGAMGYFVTQQDGVSNYTFNNITVRGTAKNTYYGAGITNAGSGVNVDLICNNVRRAVIAYSPVDSTFKITGTHAPTALGSNGYISLARTNTSRDIDNVTVDVSLTGTTNHTALVHFYHQFGTNASTGWMQNIRCNTTLDNLANTTGLSIYRFDHELDGSTIASTTARGWKDIILDAAITGTFSGTKINSASASTASGNSVGVKVGLTSNLTGLPIYFTAA